MRLPTHLKSLAATSMLIESVIVGGSQLGKASGSSLIACVGEVWRGTMQNCEVRISYLP